MTDAERRKEETRKGRSEKERKKSTGEGNTKGRRWKICKTSASDEREGQGKGRNAGRKERGKGARSKKLMEVERRREGHLDGRGRRGEKD